MDKYNGLLQRISEELGISRGTQETETNWKARIIYSAIGHVGIASLRDIEEDNIPVSITHFRRRITELLSSYLLMYPEMRSTFHVDPDKFSEEIYRICLETGCIYHSPNRIVTSAFQSVSLDGVCLLRGAPLNKKVCRSGIGAYIVPGSAETISRDLSLFGVPKEGLEQYWNDLTKSIKWSGISFNDRTEFLINKPPFTRGYFGATISTDGKISLARSPLLDSTYIYYLYRVNDGKVEAAQLPEWRVKNPEWMDRNEYRRIANACLLSLGVLPATVFHSDGELVSVHIKYLYPPAEQSLIQLYSWPREYTAFDSPFRRFMTLPVFTGIKSAFETLGYKFIEE